jgi:hypothetical protein
MLGLSPAARLLLGAFLFAGVGCRGRSASHVDARGDAGDAAAVPDGAMDGAMDDATNTEVSAAVGDASSTLDGNAPDVGADVGADATAGADGGAKDAVADGALAPDGRADADGDAAEGDADAATVCGFVMPNPASTGLPNPALYDTSGAGIVADTVTGLLWQKVSGTATFTSKEAGPHCATLTLGGFTDWRVPTVVELVSILDFTSPQGLDPHGFAGETGDLYWTSSTLPPHKEFSVGWTVAFGSRSESTFVVSPVDIFKVRCVRAGESPAPRCTARSQRYVVRADGLVLDAITGLVWQRDVAATGLSWTAAKAFCDGRAGGFRLPSLDELHTIVDYETVAPAFDPLVFPNVPISSEGPIQPNVAKSYFWTSSPVEGQAGTAWIVDFQSGQTFAPMIASPQHVRCVH